ncbi:DUF4143 domain-containing protein [Aquiluna sp. KACHI24]|uniref:ATP-binding protein n=1 Tax=Aquiluna sp. KACHI24 TaxID=2968831 RepID=UPI0021FD2ABB|nr:DUF4143 domain-containing protein [Aquiluna sp. KACHI24]BDQ00838.1 ATPase AAA [Aquiluna sp. KACHI24]
MKQRIICDALKKLLEQTPAVILDGPRGVGKTTLGVAQARTTLNLEIPALRNLAQQQPDELLVTEEPIFIDEWHLAPEIIAGVRRSVDRNRTPGRFLLAGSGSRPLPHSGVGRVNTLRVRPLLLQERDRADVNISLVDIAAGARPEIKSCSLALVDYAREIVVSGFPAFTDLDEKVAQNELDSYIQILIASDTEASGIEVRRPQLLRHWLRSYASATATLSSLESIRLTQGPDAGPSKVTALNYLEMMQMLRIIEPVEAFSLSTGPARRVSGSPKHQLADPGLAAALLGVGSRQLLNGLVTNGDRLVFAQLFESLVALHLRVFADLNQYRLYHYREWDGRREVDYILESRDGKLLLIEVKLSTPNPGEHRHLNQLAEQLGDAVLGKLVITAGGQSVTSKDGVVVLPLGSIRF